eukprot:scaffold466641_cov45-Prasinocladus_malaysianus.AAC.1
MREKDLLTPRMLNFGLPPHHFTALEGHSIVLTVDLNAFSIINQTAKYSSFSNIQQMKRFLGLNSTASAYTCSSSRAFIALPYKIGNVSDFSLLKLSDDHHVSHATYPSRPYQNP